MRNEEEEEDDDEQIPELISSSSNGSGGAASAGCKTSDEEDSSAEEVPGPGGWDCWGSDLGEDPLGSILASLGIGLGTTGAQRRGRPRALTGSQLPHAYQVSRGNFKGLRRGFLVSSHQPERVAQPSAAGVGRPKSRRKQQQVEKAKRADQTMKRDDGSSKRGAHVAEERHTSEELERSLAQAHRDNLELRERAEELRCRAEAAEAARADAEALHRATLREKKAIQELISGSAITKRRKEQTDKKSRQQGPKPQPTEQHKGYPKQHTAMVGQSIHPDAKCTPLVGQGGATSQPAGEVAEAEAASLDLPRPSLGYVVLALQDYTAPAEGYLTVYRGGWAIKLFEEDGWLYVQRVDRSKSMGWAPANMFVDAEKLREDLLALEGSMASRDGGAAAVVLHARRIPGDDLAHSVADLGAALGPALASGSRAAGAVSVATPDGQACLAMAMSDCEAAEEGYLALRKAEWVVKLYEKGEWLYCQAVDRPEDQGWAKAEDFMDIPLRYHPSELAVAVPNIERQQRLQSVHRAIILEDEKKVAEHTAIIAEATAKAAHERAHAAEQFSNELSEMYSELVHNGEAEQWRSRAMEFERQVQDLQRTLELVQNNASSEEKKLKELGQALAEAVHREREAKASIARAWGALETLQRREELTKELYPALHATVRRLDRGDLQRSCVPNSRARLPVLALRWSHDVIDKNLSFRNGKSMFYALERLMRGTMDTDGWVNCHDRQDEPVVVVEDGKFYATTANRRLTVLMMLQALNRSRELDVNCRIESLENPQWHKKFYGCPAENQRAAKSTQSQGLDVGIRDARRNVAQHEGCDLFNPESEAFSMMEHLLWGTSSWNSLRDAVDLKKEYMGRGEYKWVLRRKFDGLTLGNLRQRRHDG